MTDRAYSRNSPVVLSSDHTASLPSEKGGMQCDPLLLTSFTFIFQTFFSFINFIIFVCVKCSLFCSI